MDNLMASASEAAAGVTAWDKQFAVYVASRDGDFAVWHRRHLHDGWTTQIDLEQTTDPDDPTSREIGRRYQMRRPRDVEPRPEDADVTPRDAG